MSGKNIKTGCMVISLDFEMLWGVLDHNNLMEYEGNIKNVWKVVPMLLQLFSEYKVHATWGITGMMTEESIEKCRQNMLVHLPGYNNRKYSPYEQFDYLKTVNKKYLFAAELINKIQKSEGQELGTHTYSHFYCMEEGQTAGQFEADLLKAEESLKKYTDSVKSMLFPRNQVNENYADILKKYGIQNYRGNEEAWFYQPLERIGYCSMPRRILRFLDSYVPIAGNCCYRYENLYDRNGLRNIKSSRFLRPYQKKLELFEPVRIKRIKNQMKYAAKNRMIFHMWWHPHNFGNHIKQNIDCLTELLDYYSLLEGRYGFRSLNMCEAGGLGDEL